MTQEQREKFLAVQTYEEYEKREKEFYKLDPKDKEVREHFYSLLEKAPKKEYYNGELNYIVDDNDKCVIRTGIPHGMTRDEYIDFLRTKREEYFKNQKNE